MVRGKLITHFKTTGSFRSQTKIPFLPLNSQLDLLTRQINASEGYLCLCLPPLLSRDMCAFNRNAVCARELEIQEQRFQLTDCVI